MLYGEKGSSVYRVHGRQSKKVLEKVSNGE